jgi:hypothetical protein
MQHAFKQAKSPQKVLTIFDIKYEIYESNMRAFYGEIINIRGKNNTSRPTNNKNHLNLYPMNRSIKISFVMIVAITFIGTMSGYSQLYKPFNFESGIWIQESHVHTEYSTESQFYCHGDSLINGNIFFKLFEYRLYLPMFGFPDTTNNFVGYIRNTENKGVLFLESNTLEEKLIYDFNRNIGDTIRLYGNDFVILQIDSIKICEQYHKRFLLAGFPEEYLVEGIGFSTGLFYRGIPSSGESYSILKCYWDRSRVCETCPLLLEVSSTYVGDNIIIFPNPSINSNITIECDQNIDDIMLYDTFGKMLLRKDKINSDQLQLSIPHVNDGYYILKVHFLDRTFFSKTILIEN